MTASECSPMGTEPEGTSEHSVFWIIPEGGCGWRQTCVPTAGKQPERSVSLDGSSCTWADIPAGQGRYSHVHRFPARLWRRLRDLQGTPRGGKRPG